MPADEPSVDVCSLINNTITYQTGGTLPPALQQCFCVMPNQFMASKPDKFYAELPCLLFFMSGCFSSPSTFQIENRSNYKIDSVVISVNNKSVYFLDVQPGVSLSRLIGRDTAAGGHDIWVDGRIVVNDTTYNIPSNFLTDLGGSFDEIGVIIDKDLKTKWIIVAKKY